MPEISSYAVVERGAELADDVRIGPFSFIGPKVHLGAGCVIDNNVSITGRTTLAAKNHVFPMTVVGAPPPDSTGQGQCVIAQANDIREHVTIYAGVERPTRIGSDNLIMIGCQIGPGATIGSHGIFANCTHVGPCAHVEDYVRTSAFPVVDSGVRVGAYTFVAGYTGIDQDAPPYAMVQGLPFRVRGVNTNNLHRCGFGEDDISALKRAFRELYNGSGARPNPAALERLRINPNLNPHVRRLVEAIRSAKPAKGGGDG